ncbi:MAG: hypothetical protein A2041_02150 [Bacteroidetes bacterium GWA2_31_9b]|nr:MAG: hypothetical protein A2041_02150 [Bacteroidetes bacterium GWA2_31_9b]
MKKVYFIIIGLCFLVVSCQNEPKYGFDVIELMKSKYQNTWYKNFTFAQHVNKYKNDSVISKEIWYEAYSYPNKLIIKFNDFSSGSGVLFNNDTVYHFKDSMLVTHYKRIHDLVLLGLDVYEQPVEVNFEKLKELGYNLSKMCEATFGGREMYCIGVTDEQEQANKFYIDKEFLYFVKNVKFQGDDINETVFSNYQTIDDKLVATKILFYKNNQLIMDEEYFNIKFPEELDQNIFEPSNFLNANW